MPVNKIDYSKTIIYRIVCKDTNITECYIGSTTDFRSRKQNHKCNCNNETSKRYNLYVYEFIRDNMGWDNWNMVEIEKYNAVDKLDSHKRERYWIEFYKASLNKVIPSRTYNEYYNENKEQILEKHKEYNKKNKQQIAEQRKEYYEENKQQIIEKHKEYYEENKQQIIEKSKDYYEENKQQIAEKRKEKVTCECGCIINISNLLQHKKTKKHLNAINNI
jgi:hypothetical protein